MALIIPRRWLQLPSGIRKPAQPVLDTTHSLSLGLVGAWMLGDGPGFNAKDLLGVRHGTPTTVSLASSHHGGEAYAYVNNAIGHTVSPVVNFSNGEPISISAWGNLIFGQGGNIIGNSDGGSSSNFGLFYNSSTSISFLYGSSGYQIFGQTGSQVLYSGWHQLGFRYIYGTAATAQLYVDGQPVAGSWNTGSGNGAPSNSSTMEIAGNNNSTDNFFGGSLDCIRLYRRYLADDEFAQLFAYPYAGIIDDRPRVWFFPNISSGTVYNQTVSATTTPNASIVRSTGKVVTQNTTPNATIGRQTGKNVNATTTPNATIVRAIAKVLGATTTPNATIVRAIGKIIAASTTPNAAVVRSIAKILGATTTPNASIVRAVGKIIAASTTPNATMAEAKGTLYHQTVSIDTTPNASISTQFNPASTGGGDKLVRIIGAPKLKSQVN